MYALITNHSIFFACVVIWVLTAGSPVDKKELEIEAKGLDEKEAGHEPVGGAP